MTKSEFQKWSRHNLIYLDGATGSNLIRAGMPTGVCPEQWILDHPETFIELQRAYAAAGSNIVYAPTFSANRVKLAEYGLADRIEEMTVRLVELSRQAVGEKVLIAGDITMTGRQLRPTGSMKLEELIEVYKEQIKCLVKAGVDLLVIETMMSLQETRAAVIAAKETCDLPVMVTMTFEKNGRTLFGTDAVTAAVVLESLGADAIGANCSSGPDRMADVIRAMAEVTRVPVIAKPNAGMPAIDAAGRTCYDMSPEEFVSGMRELVRAGATILGGCCGTDPLYIAGIKSALGTERALQEDGFSIKMERRFLASERRAVSFGLEDGFLVVGERINPTGKKKLQASLLEGSMELVTEYATQQEENGAAILDVNLGMPGIDENTMMLQAIEALGTVTDLPLAIDTSHVEVMEAALRHYPGRALINSISLEKEKFEKLIPLAKKYGAMFILLPLSDAGLPANQEEKRQIIETIYERALSLGLTREDIIVDGLVNTVGANRDAALQALDTIAYCKEQGFATICGLSNISFGLPERSFVNTAFLTMAITRGLTMAIANPSQELLMGCCAATDLLLAKNGSDMHYIERAGQLAARREVLPVVSRKQPEQVGTDHSAPAGLAGELYEAILRGNKRNAVSFAEEGIVQGSSAEELLNMALMPAIERVGMLFEKGKYFLPQLIASAEAMKAAIAILEPHMTTDKSDQKMPTVIIATVEGDIHDIGKNLVALMLKNCGFQVVDLGKDVSAGEIVDAARERGAELIALSALMTTTMVQMEGVVRLVRETLPGTKVIIGGAVITQAYARQIGADGYASDAAAAVKEARRLLGIQDGI